MIGFAHYAAAITITLFAVVILVGISLLENRVAFL